MKIKDILLFLPREFYSGIAKTYRANLDDNVKNKILDEGMYHFTPNEEVANAIMESGYLKPASGGMKYIDSYGTPVACLFAGNPDIDNYIKNITGTNVKNNPYINPCMVKTAIKVLPENKDDLKNYKIRNLSDNSILYEGFCILPQDRVEIKKMVPDLVRDNQQKPIKDKNGEYIIAFREARKEEIIEGSDVYLAQKDYLDFVRQKSIELGYSKNQDHIAGKINNYITNIVDQGRSERDSIKLNFMQNMKKNLGNIFNKYKMMLKNLGKPKLESSVENIMNDFQFDKKNPYQSKKIGKFIANLHSKNGLKQLKLRECLEELTTSQSGEYLKKKYIKIEQVMNDKKGIHGTDHSNRVILNSMMIAQKEGILINDNDNRIKDILITASALHDIGRIGNNGPHARRSANKINKMNLSFENGQPYSKEDKKMLIAIVESHEGKPEKIGKMNKKYRIDNEKDRNIVVSLSKILRDADALDRVRLDRSTLIDTKVNLNPEFLQTNTAKQMIISAYELENLTKNKSMNSILSYKTKTSADKFKDKYRVTEGIDPRKAMAKYENTKNSQNKERNANDEINFS